MGTEEGRLCSQILYVENAQESPRKLPVLIHEFSNIAGYKTSTQELVVFLYTSSAPSNMEIKGQFRPHWRPEEQNICEWGDVTGGDPAGGPGSHSLHTNEH